MTKISEMAGTKEGKEYKEEKRRKIIQSLIVSIIMLCSTLSFYIIIFVFTQYVYHRVAHELYPNDTRTGTENHSCVIEKNTTEFIHKTTIQEHASNYLLVNSLVVNIPAILTNIGTAALSDRFGRKRMLALNMSFYFIRLVLTCVGMYLEFPLNYFYIFTAIEAVGGGFFGAISVSFAIIADLSKTGSRAIMITLLEIFFGIGMIVAGFVSAYLIEDLGFLNSTIIACGMQATGLILLFVFLKESLPSYKRKDSTVFSNIRNAFTFYIKDTSEEGKAWKYNVCLLVFVFGCFGSLGKIEIEQLYQLNVPFCWTSVKIGWFATAFAIIRIIPGMGSVKLLKSFLSDASIVVVSMVSNTAYCVMEAFATNDVMLFIVPPLGIFSVLFFPLVRAIMSQMTPPDRQGALFGGISVAETASSMVINSMSKAIYSATVSSFGGAVFLVMGAFTALAAVLMLIYKIRTKTSKSGKISQSEEFYVEPAESFKKTTHF